MEQPPSGPPSGEPPRGAMSRGYARGRERDDAIRASLVPLAPGERPGAVNVAIAVALVLAIANVGLWAVGVDVGGDGGRGGLLGIVVFAALMLAVAVGMWQVRYGAVLAFQALLAITVVIAALSLLVASNLAAVALCAAIVALGGWLFWKLVRALARIQMPPGASDH